MTGRGYRGPLGLRLTLRMAPEELFRFAFHQPLFFSRTWFRRAVTIRAAGARQQSTGANEKIFSHPK